MPSESSLSEDACVCGCPAEAHMGKPSGCQQHGFHEFEKPAEQIHKWKKCTGCRHQQHSSQCMSMLEETGDNCRCLALTSMQDIAMSCRRGGGCPEHPVTVQLRQEPEEPPLTPEEEEEAGSCVHPEGYEGECPCPPSCDCCKAEPSARLLDCGLCFEENGEEVHPHPECPIGAPPPPQPERRPPYAVAYSVGGHLYEVAVPGDATAQAVDGALIITHSLGQVAGIVRIMPMQKEASDG